MDGRNEIVFREWRAGQPARHFGSNRLSRRPAVGRSTPRRPAGPAAHRGGARDAKPGTRGSGPAERDPAPTRDLERGPEPRRVVGFARAVGRSVAPGPPGRFDASGRPSSSAPAGPPPPCTELQKADIAFVAHG